MKNKKSYAAKVAAVAIALSLSGAAMAADLGNLSGQSCGDATGTWHFINNQVRGSSTGTLTASWSSGDSCAVGASKVNSTTQHFYCIASGALQSASTNLNGKLVLSDFSCQTTCDPDPKTGNCPTPPK